MQMETHASNCGSFRQPYVPINKKKEGPVYSTFTWSTFLKSVWNVCYCGKLLRQQKKKYWFVFFRNMKKNPKIRKQLLHKFMMKLQSILLLNFVILECKLSLKVPVSYHVRIQPCGVILVFFPIDFGVLTSYWQNTFGSGNQRQVVNFSEKPPGR